MSEQTRAIFDRIMVDDAQLLARLASWEVDVHDHWDDTPIILQAADELP